MKRYDGDGVPTMQLRFLGGDGDQSYLSGHHVAATVKEDWFPDITPRGRALLVRLTSGPHRGEYLALTSRIVDSLETQVGKGKHVDVVVHAVRNPGPGFEASMENLPAVGRAILEIGGA